ncbi:S-adenosyl-L-methionine-dependent methyltransferase [Calocera viscosa TUFC12733]|uniref:S-adenosyl-L-methionine-dependent methyltransferase n=1 Tax=Calocera viscosa (strain TUFC12733) TaxID=1330018 RepID=A0A167JTX0_CALVF|nr:S-adenosyl-L-methionine-dependent methyltransferase [Calocera viscosa TUFC12733]
MASTILQLSKLISDATAVITDSCAGAGTAVPELDAPFDPAQEAWRQRPGVQLAVDQAISAAHQLIATLQPAPLSVLRMGGSYHITATRVAFESNVATIIKELGGNGVHVDAIAVKAKVDPKKLVRVLRFLASQHVFREIEPDVFANNRISSCFDIGKPFSELVSNPVTKYEGTSGITALFGHMMDEMSKSGAYAWEALSDPKTAFSEEPEDAPLSRAFGTHITFWDWMEEPEQVNRLARFGVAMRAWQNTLPADAMLHGFNWLSLTENDLIVDVAGGIGNAVLPIARANPAVRVIIQDRPAVIDDGIKYWNEEYPEALDSGRVKLEIRDLFAAQPIKNASVFLLRRILHDWSDKYVRKILTTLREAAAPSTKLLIIDSIMHYVCADPTLSKAGVVPGWASARRPDAPPPLLPNWGTVGIGTYGSDLHMMILHNSQERTLTHLSTLLESTGWRMVRVYPDQTNLMSQVEAVPI